jgi:hypothetical protein
MCRRATWRLRVPPAGVRNHLGRVDERSTVRPVATPHRVHVEELLRQAAADHADLVSRLPAELQRSLPVDAQGLTRAIDYLADEAGLSVSERRALVRPHALNPAVLHARIFGREPLARGTVLGAFVEGARVRAEALGSLADSVGGPPLGQAVRNALVEHPPPVDVTESAVVDALRATYAAQERAVMMIATALDALR